jgi:hypothetical protein
MTFTAVCSAAQRVSNYKFLLCSVTDSLNSVTSYETVDRVSISVIDRDLSVIYQFLITSIIKNKVVMILREIILTHYAVRAQLAAFTNSPGRWIHQQWFLCRQQSSLT